SSSEEAAPEEEGGLLGGLAGLGGRGLRLRDVLGGGGRQGLRGRGRFFGQFFVLFPRRAGAPPPTPRAGVGRLRGGLFFNGLRRRLRRRGRGRRGCLRVRPCRGGRGRGLRGAGVDAEQEQGLAPPPFLLQAQFFF